MLHLATLLLASALVPPLVSSSPWNNPSSNQYHIQTDEGPERYFRYQTDNGQYRKEKRLQDGTVIGTYAWIDDNGYLRQRDYIADSQGYRIVKNKNIFVGRNVNVGEAVKAAKKVSNTYGTSVKINNFPQVSNTGYIPVTPKPKIYASVSPSVELSLNSIPSSTPAPILHETSISSTYLPSEPNSLGYISTSTLSPLTGLYLPSSEAPTVFISSRNPSNIVYSSTNSPKNYESFSTSTISPISSVSDLLPISPTTFSPSLPSLAQSSFKKPYSPVTSNPSKTYLSTSEIISSSPRPFNLPSSTSSVYIPSQTPIRSSSLVSHVTSPPTHYYSSTPGYLDITSFPREYTSQPRGINSNSIEYSGNAEYRNYPENFVNPYIHQNGPTYPLDTKGHSFNPTYNNIGNGYDPQYPYYDGISVTNDGFRYYIPRAYHEEQNTKFDSKSGSFGYVDPFGIRRVIYYNAGPDGFKHRKNNRYVGLNGTPYDPRPY